MIIRSEYSVNLKIMENLLTSELVMWKNSEMHLKIRICTRHYLKITKKRFLVRFGLFLKIINYFLLSVTVTQSPHALKDVTSESWKLLWKLCQKFKLVFHVREIFFNYNNVGRNSLNYLQKVNNTVNIIPHEINQKICLFLWISIQENVNYIFFLSKTFPQLIIY